MVNCLVNIYLFFSFRNGWRFLLSTSPFLQNTAQSILLTPNIHLQITTMPIVRLVSFFLLESLPGITYTFLKISRVSVQILQNNVNLNKTDSVGCSDLVVVKFKASGQSWITPRLLNESFSLGYPLH